MELKKAMAGDAQDNLPILEGKNKHRISIKYIKRLEFMGKDPRCRIVFIVQVSLPICTYCVITAEMH